MCTQLLRHQLSDGTYKHITLDGPWPESLYVDLKRYVLTGRWSTLTLELPEDGRAFDFQFVKDLFEMATLRQRTYLNFDFRVKFGKLELESYKKQLQTKESGEPFDSVAMAEDTAFTINPSYYNPEQSDKISSILKGVEECVPFPHFVFDEFLDNGAEAMKALRAELKSEKMPWHPKNNDLYSLDQTLDLGDVSANDFPNIKKFRSFLMKPFGDYLRERTGRPLLDDEFTITGSSYTQTHNLLLHDDKNAKRQIAFVYYLCEDEWKQEDGGQLQLYKCNSTGEPSEIAVECFPKPNQMMIFMVSNHSWHRVAEVLSANKERLSINGWFHVAEPEPHNPAPFNDSLFVSREILDADEFTEEDTSLLAINPGLYDVSETLDQIADKFASESSVQLKDFLLPGSYTESAILDELDQLQFPITGPPHKRCFGALSEDAIPEDKKAVRLLLRGVRSHIMCHLLGTWTDTDFNYPSGESPEPKKAKVENEEDEEQPDFGNIRVVAGFRKYSAGCYTTMDDQLRKQCKQNIMDLRIFFTRKWDASEDDGAHVSGPGGFLCYYGADEDKSMYNVTPSHNTAVVVFRDPEVLSFVKYINARAGKICYYALECSYYGMKDGTTEPLRPKSAGITNKSVSEEIQGSDTRKRVHSDH
ncbi:hypothetical protein QR680_015724 [Steinernema hermaphroditum]|uniref:Prolyl 4-hydroxylase alpha subunit domain-containing protein n=1 Tax=Steinernema hermaphroditum TaxID=289476 RepID=A0AA39H9R1_9BILA|nr:hypothetical protein QR680_015724 [Steinernema hermaphroditum]